MQHIDLSPLGAFLRHAREAARLSIRQFADALDYSPSHLSDVERGQRAVTRQMCDQLSKTLGLDRVELYARAGHLTDEVLVYLCRRPKALGVLELLAAEDASDEVVEKLCTSLRRDEPRSPASHAAMGDPLEASTSCAMKQLPGDGDLEAVP